MGRPIHKPIRWSLNQAGEEFGVARQTVKNQVTRKNIVPGDDGLYSTAQIVSALFDIDGTKKEKYLKLAAERELVEVELSRRKGETILEEDAARAWTELLMQTRARWLQLAAKAAVAFPTWPDARGCEAWVDSEVRDLLNDLATNPDYNPKNPEIEGGEGANDTGSKAA